MKWSDSSPGGPLISGLFSLGQIASFSAKPECALSTKIGFLEMNLALSLIPFVLVMLIVIYGLILGMKKPKISNAVVRSSIAAVSLTALPSLIKLLSIFDCTSHVDADDNKNVTYVMDGSRDVLCFTSTYYQYAAVHLVLIGLWVRAVQQVHKHIFKEFDRNDVWAGYIFSSKYGGLVGRYNYASRKYWAYDLRRKVIFSLLILFTDSNRDIQIVSVAAWLFMSGISKARLRPHRSSLANFADSAFSLFPALTLTAGYMYEDDDTKQSWALFIAILPQILLVITLMIIQAKSSLFKVIKQKRMLKTAMSDNKARVSALETALLGMQSSPFTCLSDLSLDVVAPTSDVNDLFSDGGTWKNVHTLILSDPGDDMILQYVRASPPSYDALGKLLSLAICLKNWTVVKEISMAVAMRSGTQYTDDDVSSMMNVVCSTLLSLYKQIDTRDPDVLTGVSVLRQLAVSILARITDTVNERHRLMNLPLPGGKWKIDDALVGDDHLYIIEHVEGCAVDKNAKISRVASPSSIPSAISGQMMYSMPTVRQRPNTRKLTRCTIIMMLIAVLSTYGTYVAISSPCYEIYWTSSATLPDVCI